MQEFLTTLASFPTIVFTGALAMALLYWLVVIFGAIDMDFLDSALGLDSMDAAFDGAIESLEGAAEGLEGAEGALGGAEGAEGAAEATEAADADASDGVRGGLLSSLMNAMGARGVPITIVGTFVIFWAWILSYLGTRFFGSAAASLLVGSALAVASGFAGIFMAALSTRPMKKLFVTHLAPKRAALVGKMCTVLSARVDGTFGRAEIEDGGAGFVAEVRCPQENDLKRGAKALVYRYEPSAGVFFIGPVDAVLTEAAQIAEES